MQEVAGPQRKVATVENPVEQQLPWVTQVEINAKSRNSVSVLRAFMYQYVDVIMVSTLGDLETMDLAILAAETGHLTLAPVHVASAVDPARRFVDVFPPDQKPSIRTMLAKSLLGTIAMRLARVLCPHCRQPDELSPTALAHVREMARQGGYTVPDDAVFFRAAGCVACGYTGYHGRTGIYEVLEVDAAFRAAVLHTAPREELLQIALAGGMQTLTAEGIRKAAEGITSLDEIVALGEETMANENGGVATEAEDALYAQALEYIHTTQFISTAMLQRRFRIGYTRAVQLMDSLAERGLVAPGVGSKLREVTGNTSPV